MNRRFVVQIESKGIPPRSLCGKPINRSTTQSRSPLDGQRLTLRRWCCPKHIAAQQVEGLKGREEKREKLNAQTKLKPKFHPKKKNTKFQKYELAINSRVAQCTQTRACRGTRAFILAPPYPFPLPAPNLSSSRHYALSSNLQSQARYRLISTLRMGIHHAEFSGAAILPLASNYSGSIGNSILFSFCARWCWLKTKKIGTMLQLI